jgi:hypothetical protein
VGGTLVKALSFCGAVLAAALLFRGAEAQEKLAIKELAPAGKLRAGVVFAPGEDAK